MGKKQKEETPNVNATTNRDIVQRLNFLYQASVYLQSTAPILSSRQKDRQVIDANAGHNSVKVDSSASEEASIHRAEIINPEKKKERRKVYRKDTGDLARSYVQSMRVVGQKTTVKMDPSLKRSLCSNCSTVLVPGSTASIRVKNSRSHGHTMVYTCLHCRTTKRIPAPPNTAPVGILEHGEPDDQAAESAPNTQSAVLPPPPVASVRRGNKRAPIPRPLPLFARQDAGHVLFRGNERLELQSEGGSGSCFG